MNGTLGSIDLGLPTFFLNGVDFGVETSALIAATLTLLKVS
jgi:hypothetical protein